MIDAGMHIIHCNMSHGDHEEQSVKLANLEKTYELSLEDRGKVKVFMDNRGPEIGTSLFQCTTTRRR